MSGRGNKQPGEYGQPMTKQRREIAKALLDGSTIVTDHLGRYIMGTDANNVVILNAGVVRRMIRDDLLVEASDNQAAQIGLTKRGKKAYERYKGRPEKQKQVSNLSFSLGNAEETDTRTDALTRLAKETAPNRSAWLKAIADGVIIPVNLGTEHHDRRMANLRHLAKVLERKDIHDLICDIADGVLEVR